MRDDQRLMNLQSEELQQHAHAAALSISEKSAEISQEVELADAKAEMLQAWCQNVLKNKLQSRPQSIKKLRSSWQVTNKISLQSWRGWQLCW